MFYNQKVKIKNTTFNKVVDSFHDLDFVKFLITLQPVRIIKWAGILDGDRAHFMFWFFGWKDFKVVHKNYTKATKNFFCFTDYGQVLPLGLIYWKHDHTVLCEDNEVYILDQVEYKHKNFLGFVLYPFLIAPIFIIKILYKLYF